MKKLIMILVLFFLCIETKAATNKIVSINGNCEGCIAYPLTTTILCQAPSFCTRIMAPDWTNANVFYGTDASNCRKSIDGAITWSNCTANPSTTAVYLHYAVTNSGSILAVGNDAGGTVTRIKRSIDGAVTWSQVYSATPPDTMGYSPNGRFRCAQTANLCTFIYKDSGNNVISLISTDDGQTWTVNSTIGLILYANGTMVLNDSGSLGIMIPNASDGFSNYKAALFDGSTWTLSTIWPTTTGGQCNWAFVLNSVRNGVCHVGASGTTYTLHDINGVVQKTFTLPDVPSDNGGSVIGLAISIVNNWIALLRTDTTGKTGVWVSIDAGTSFTKLFTTDPGGGGIGNQGSIFKGVNGCMYTSYVTSGASTVLKVC